MSESIAQTRQGSKRRKLYPVTFGYKDDGATTPAAAVVIVYRMLGDGTLATVDLTALAATQGLCITDLCAVQVAAGQTVIFGGTLADNTIIRRGSFVLGGGLGLPLSGERYLLPQAALKVTSASRIDVYGEGWIYDGFD